MSILQKIFNFFYEIFFGCSHERLTRPFTLHEQTYKVCLDCGSQIYYSTDTMRPLSPREVRRLRAVQAGEVKIVPTAAPTRAVLSPQDGKSNAA